LVDASRPAENADSGTFIYYKGKWAEIIKEEPKVPDFSPNIWYNP